MKKAWIENGKIRDIAQGVPENIYHPDLAEKYTANVPDNAENGDGWDGVTLTKPQPPPPPPAADPESPSLPVSEFLMLFTAAEASEMDASTDADVVRFMIILADTRTTAIDMKRKRVKQFIQKLEDLGIITNARRKAILKGEEA